MSSKILVEVLIGGSFLVAIVTGFYPVAMVDGTPVFYRTWRKTDEAAKHFANTQLILRGESPIDFSASRNAELLLEGRKETLTSLIEDVILRQEGKKFWKNFNKSLSIRVLQALESGEDVERAVKAAYNLDLDDFQDIVLLPQARRDLVSEILRSSNQGFEEWLGEVKKRKRIFLIFVPFRWKGGRIQ